ncbi:hypothetical protein ACROYT_G036424 [Oculina patagonica]
MEDFEILPKRRKLDSLVEQTNGYNVKNATTSDNANNVQKTKSLNKIEHHKEIKWNFKLVRPEVLKCCRRIVEGLNGGGPAGKRSNEYGAAETQQNGLIPSREKEKECAFAPKRKLEPECVKQSEDKETTPASGALPTKCSAVVTIPRENSGSSKEKSSGYTVKNQAPTQQHLLERLIPSSLSKEKVREEIRKIMKEHTREAMDRAESLKSRISTLENENRWLQHKVTILYSALKKALARRKEKKGLQTAANKTQVKPNEAGCLETLLQPQPVPEAAIQEKAKDGAFQAFQKTIATANSDSLRSGSETLDNTSVKGTPSSAARFGHQIRAPHNTTTPSVEKKITNSQTTRSVGTGSQSPNVSLGNEETPSYVHLPNHFPTLSNTPQAFGSSKKTNLFNGNYSSASDTQHKVTTLSSNGNTSKVTPSPVSLLCQVLDEILATSSNDFPDQFTLNKQCGPEAPKVSKTFHEPLPRSAIEIPLPGTIPDGSEGFLHKQSSPPVKRKIPMNANTLSEKPHQGDTKTLLDQHGAKHLSPITPDQRASETESKHRVFLGNSSNLKTDGQKKTSPLINDEMSHFKCHTETHLPDSHLQSNVFLPAASSSPVSSISQLVKSIPVTSSGSPSVLGISGQSVSLLDGIDMLAQAAGLGNTTAEPILRPERSSKTHTPSLGRTTPDESIKIHNQDLSQESLKNDAVGKVNTSDKITPEAYCTKSQSIPLPEIFISLPDEPQKHKLALKQDVSTNGSLKVDYTSVLSKHVDGHHNWVKAKEKQFDKKELLKPHTNVKDLPFQQEERPTSRTQEDNSALVTKGFSNCDPRLAAASPNKIQTVTYHAKPEEGHNLPSTPRFYNNRDSQDHTLRQPETSTYVRTHVVSKPRYLPYPPIRPKVQQTPFIPVSSNIQYVPKMNDRQSPKAGMPRLIPPLNANAQSSRNSQCSLSPRWLQVEEKSAKRSNEELLYQLPRLSGSPNHETSPSKVRLTSSSSANTNTSPSYNKESLLLQLLPSDRATYIPHYSASKNCGGSSRATQGFSNVQTMNAVNLPSMSSETSKRYVYLPPKRLVQNSMQNPRESPICSSGQTESGGIDLPGKPPLSVGESHRERSSQTRACSSSSVSLHTNSALTPQIELSYSCQQYLTQLRKSPLPFTHENSIYTTAKLIPQSESRAIDRNNNSRQTSYSSTKRQARQQEGYDTKQVNPQAPSTQSKKESSYLSQHQRPSRVLYHHKKIHQSATTTTTTTSTS